MTVLLAMVLAAAATWLVAPRPRHLLADRLRPSRTATRRLRRDDRPRPHLRGRKAEQRRREAVTSACLTVAAELAAGVPAARALAGAAAEWPDLFERAATEARIGGDVASALRTTAELPGCDALRAVAAGWDVTEQTGAPLARTLVAVADVLRAEATVRREAASQLATARTTARLLAALPFATLLLLSGGGGNAVAFLLTTPVGWACLAAAAALGGVGVWWVDRLARSAQRTSWLS